MSSPNDIHRYDLFAGGAKLDHVEFRWRAAWACVP
jgi:hypothetical protein